VIPAAKYSIVLVALGVAACVDVTAPKLPAAERFDAPFSYLAWWREVQNCSGWSGRLGGVRFYRVVATPGRDSLDYLDPDSGRYLNGEWIPRSNSIYLAAGQVTNPGVVRHEMLHALLRDTRHPPRYFADLCGQLVSY
jgi:hypothetical protein